MTPQRLRPRLTRLKPPSATFVPPVGPAPWFMKKVVPNATPADTVSVNRNTYKLNMD